MPTRKIIFIAILLLLNGNTQVFAQKTSRIAQIYHNITARFNGYYNADVKLQETIQLTEKRVRDDYAQLLPIFIYPNEAEGKSNAGNLDEAIKKCSKVVQNHEKSTWIDECFLLIGKSYFYKADYFNAIESFQYTYTKYRKESTNPEALLWLAKCYIQTKQMREAEKALETAINLKERFPSKLKANLYATYADFYIKELDYNQAALKLETAINATKKKKQATRYRFVLGQLFALANNNNKALSAYEKVLKGNPTYDMQLNTQLNMAKLYNVRNSMASSIKNKLLKMTRESKNKEYLDQIYFELGNIAIKEKKEDEALKYYKLSAASSVQNTNQKTISYLTIAELFYKKANYAQSKLYYDSTATFIAANNEKYDEVTGRKNYLGDLVRNLETIQLQDSLISLGKLDKNRQDKVLDEAVKRIKKEQEALSDVQNTGNAFFDANDPRQQARNQGFGGNGGLGAGGDPFGGPQGRGNGNAVPDWYFYNPTAVAQGLNEFNRKWGTRTLEDDWRRSKKTTEITDDPNQTPTENATDVVALKDLPTDSKALRSVLQRTIPQNENEIARCENKIADATYAAAGIYRDRLGEQKKAIELLEKLINRFASYKQLEQALYALYLLYKDLPNAQKADFYKNELLAKFPASTLTNPATTTPQNADLATEDYTKAYNFFAAEDYTNTQKACANGIKSYKGSPEEPKFAYLNALCAGKMGGVAAMLDALKKVQQDYPNDPVKDAAQQIFDVLSKPATASTTAKPNNAQNPNPAIDPSANPNEIFAKNFSDTHFFILALSLTLPNTTEAQTKITDFNSLNYSLLNLRTNSATLGDTYQLHTVKSFANKDKAIEYFYSIAAQMQVILPDVTAENYKVFVISQTNYTVMYRQQLLNQYLTFFENNYLTE